ncbi:hypothetical protein CDO44_07720 [Pigmentiphaga sp. NML080357]|nr:hypothetical protein CDO44_07720 [Pigmentiphaga sp. NML080357]
MPAPKPVNSPDGPDAAAMLDAWRERGAHRLDPVRFHFIEALARRAAGHTGEARRILDERLARLLAAYEQDVEKAGGLADGGEQGAAIDQGQSSGGGLAELAARLDASRAAAEAGGDLDVLEYFRNLWARLRVGSELRQAMENVPENAGPLNSLHLVHQSLMLMHDVAPEYLRHFLSYADALSWMERMSGADLLLGRDASPRGEAPKKAAKGRSA